jgi:hypothetical protein
VLADLREKLVPFYSDIGRPSIDPAACTDADLEFLTEEFNRQLTGVNAEIWVHTCWGNPNQQRVHWSCGSRSGNLFGE